jgi:hypothetical protein
MDISPDSTGKPMAFIPSTVLGSLGRSGQLRVKFLCVADPSPAQIAVAKRLAISASMEPLLLASALEEWNHLAADLADVGFAMISPNQLPDLAEKIHIGQLHIHDNPDDARGPRFGFSGEWEIDPEHGLGILLQGSMVLEVGHQDVALTRVRPVPELMERIAVVSTALTAKRQELASLQAKAAAPEPEGALNAAAVERMLNRFIAKTSARIAIDERELTRLRRIVAAG